MKKHLSLLLFLISTISFAQLETGFQNTLVNSSFEYPVGITFDHNNRAYVWEKRGKLWIMENGVKQANPVIDISDEVADYGDLGLLGVVLHPNFNVNGYIYLDYVVDRYYLFHSGDANYNPATTQQGATISRITRYKLDASNNFNSIVPNSRFILLGETPSTGVPETGKWHAGGTLIFGQDGTLLASYGDGTGAEDYQDQAVADGIIPLTHKIDNYRPQLLESMNGKILRLDPITGDGLSSNPFYEPDNPRSAKSRIWAMGFRNPFRILLKPETGQHSPSLGQPGTIYVGDVGNNTYEEINVITTPGKNYGWPIYEGFSFIPFPGNPNNNFSIIHEKPNIQYRAGTTTKGKIGGVEVSIGTPQFAGNSLTGNSTVGGVWYTGSSFPANYHDSYIAADYTPGFINSINFNSGDEPFRINRILNTAGNVVGTAFNATEDAIYFTQFPNGGGHGEIRKITYEPTGNIAPKAEFTYSPVYGNTPLVVNFDASTSTDPENGPLTYSWLFGSTSGSGVNPQFTFTGTNGVPQKVKTKLTVTDNGGKTDTISYYISLNNTPPQILSTSISAIDTFTNDNNFVVNLNANIIDNEQTAQQLSYQWQQILHHNDHIHIDYSTNNLQESVPLYSVPCDGNIYFYELKLTVDDGFGLKDVYSKYIYPDCNSGNSPPTEPVLSVAFLDSKRFKLKWEPATDADGIISYEVFVNNQSKGIFASSVLNYTLISPTDITGVEYEAYILAKDNLGATTPSSIIKFKLNQSFPCQSQVYLSNLVPTSSTNGYGPVEFDQTNGGPNANDGSTIMLDGISYPKGIGMHADASVNYTLGGNYTTFYSKVGIPDNNGSYGDVIFKVFAENIEVYNSGSIKGTDLSKTINLNISGVNLLRLEVNSNGNTSGDHAVWGGTSLTSCGNTNVNPPTEIGNLTIVNSTTKNELLWSATSDDITTTIYYEIVLDGQILDTISQTTFTLPDLAVGQHVVHIQAFDGNNNTTASKKINIEILECPEHLDFEKITDDLLNQEKEFKAEHTIEATNVLEGPSSRIKYRAEEHIQLNPGFEIKDQGYFEATIGACEN